MNKLPKPHLTPRERRHAKQVALLTRWHKKVAQAIKTLAKSERIIPRLEKSLERYDRTMVMAPLGKVEPVVADPAPKTSSEAEILPEGKPKRKRKPKIDALGLGF
jgi:hypothetical protein